MALISLSLPDNYLYSTKNGIRGAKYCPANDHFCLAYQTEKGGYCCFNNIFVCSQEYQEIYTCRTVLVHSFQASFTSNRIIISWKREFVEGIKTNDEMVNFKNSVPKFFEPGGDVTNTLKTKTLDRYLNYTIYNEIPANLLLKVRETVANMIPRLIDPKERYKAVAEVLNLFPANVRQNIHDISGFIEKVLNDVKISYFPIDQIQNLISGDRSGQLPLLNNPHSQQPVPFSIDLNKIIGICNRLDVGIRRGEDRHELILYDKKNENKKFTIDLQQRVIWNSNGEAVSIKNFDVFLGGGKEAVEEIIYFLFWEKKKK